MIDHLVWATTELETGRREIAGLTGVEAAPGGRHPGVGTHNALLDLGADRYLEILAPDPQQDRLAGLGRLLEGRRSSALATWCAASTGLEATAAAARRAGLEPGEIVAMSCRRPDGTRLAWRLLFLAGHPFGELVPFFIEWGPGSEHPSRAAPGGCRLLRLSLGHPDSGALAGGSEAELASRRWRRRYEQTR